MDWKKAIIGDPKKFVLGIYGNVLILDKGDYIHIYGSEINLHGYILIRKIPVRIPLDEIIINRTWGGLTKVPEGISYRRLKNGHIYVKLEDLVEIKDDHIIINRVFFGEDFLPKEYIEDPRDKAAIDYSYNFLRKSLREIKNKDHLVKVLDKLGEIWEYDLLFDFDGEIVKGTCSVFAGFLSKILRRFGLESHYARTLVYMNQKQGGRKRFGGMSGDYYMHHGVTIAKLRSKYYILDPAVAVTTGYGDQDFIREFCVCNLSSHPLKYYFKYPLGCSSPNLLDSKLEPDI